MGVKFNLDPQKEKKIPELFGFKLSKNSLKFIANKLPPPQGPS